MELITIGNTIDHTSMHTCSVIRIHTYPYSVKYTIGQLIFKDIKFHGSPKIEKFS